MVVLAGRLSNRDFQKKLERAQRIVARLSGQRASIPPRTARPAPLLETILQLLKTTPEPVRVVEIRSAVESILGYSVPMSSIKNCLAKNANRPDSPVRRIGRGHYTVMPPPETLC